MNTTDQANVKYAVFEEVINGVDHRVSQQSYASYESALMAALGLSSPNSTTVYYVAPVKD